MKRHLNTSYRLVWNHITGTLVVASELARSRGKRAGVADALVAQLGAKISRRGFGALFDGSAHVDLQQEVHAAAQVKPEVHRQRIEAQQPTRRIGHEVGSDDVARIGAVGIARLLEHRLGLALLLGRRRSKAHAHGVLLRGGFLYVLCFVEIYVIL